MLPFDALSTPPTSAAFTATGEATRRIKRTCEACAGPGPIADHHRDAPKRRARSRVRSSAVLPLENLSNDATQDYSADGMINHLGQISAIRVISRTSAMT